MNPNPLSNTFACPSCGEHIEASSKFIGLRMECPHCGSVVIVPPISETAATLADASRPGPPPHLTEEPLHLRRPDEIRRRRKRIILISVMALLLILLIVALFLRGGSGGGAGGGHGHGVKKDSGNAAGSDPDGTLPYDAGQGNQAAGNPRRKTAPSEDNSSSSAILLERTGTQDGTNGGAGNIGGGGTSFFGLSARGESFIYIVDCSGSMNGDNKLDIAKESLLFSISQLNEKQQFFVFFYETATHPMPGGKMLKATSQNKEACREWVVRKIRAKGGTEPEDSLRAAIRMKPDVIFFMSDGEFPVEVCDRIKKTQGDNPVTIHAICFVSRRGESVLKQLASDSGGSYSFVPRDAKNP